MQDRGERRVLGVPDVLAHLDGGHGVVRAPGLRPPRDVPVVDVQHLDELAEAACGDLLPYVRGLFGGEGDGGDADAVVLGRVQGQRTPAAADVQEPCAGPQSELAADQLQLVALRVGGAVAGRVAGPVAAGVRHRLVEEQRVEGVGQVVVVTDRRPVAGLAVQGPAESGAGGGDRRPGADRAEAQGEARRPEPVREGGRRRGEATVARGAAHGAQPVAEVGVEVDVAGDVSLGEAEFARLPQQPAQRSAGPHMDGGGIPGPGLAAVPHPYPDRRRAAEEPLDQRFDALGGPGRGAPGGGLGAVVVTRSPRGSAAVAAHRDSRSGSPLRSRRDRRSTSGGRRRRSRGRRPRPPAR